jgi:threonine synthase
MYIRLWSGNQNERDQLKDLGANGRIILKWILTDYVDSACSAFTRMKKKKPSVVATAMKIQVPSNVGNFLITFTSQKRL